ncbi:phospholipid scramblase 1-like isoform X2 [Drosophila willistoni]|uniref:phospholipid scramblase 1-like isoform X2 n=1 Tax=Drosophila willistoni TaxID=7260 RepID=UPI001F0832D7|nr:phospholipid scramblase 1-like isoform X2 [Drosophila willistoni]
MSLKSSKSTASNYNGGAVRLSNPDFDILAGLSQLHISRRVEKFTRIAGNEYAFMSRVKNSTGQQIFVAYEKSTYSDRTFLGNSRPFEMHVYDNFNRHVMHLQRPCSCADDNPVFPCCLNRINVFCPFGRTSALKEHVGRIQQKYWSFRSKFNIINGLGKVLLQIVGPKKYCCCCQCTDNQSFALLSPDGDNLNMGKILPSTWQHFTDGNYFMVEFPLDMDTVTKALILAASFLIEIVFYEKN